MNSFIQRLLGSSDPDELKSTHNESTAVELARMLYWLMVVGYSLRTIEARDQTHLVHRQTGVGLSPCCQLGHFANWEQPASFPLHHPLCGAAACRYVMTWNRVWICHHLTGKSSFHLELDPPQLANVYGAERLVLRSRGTSGAHRPCDASCSKPRSFTHAQQLAQSAFWSVMPAVVAGRLIGQQACRKHDYCIHCITPVKPG